MSDAGDYLGDLGAAPGGQGGRVLEGVALLGVELGALRAQVDALRQAVDAGQTDREHLAGLPGVVERLRADVTALAELGDEVDRLGEAVAELLDRGPAEDPPRPVDLAHVSPEQRETWLAELADWVRDTLFAGWPWTQARLRACWPQHPDLVNDVAWLRTAYRAAYDHPSGRAHHAADFRRWLDEAMATAEQTTRGCPLPGTPDAHTHTAPSPPRDDTAGLAAAQRTRHLAEIHRLVVQANHPDTAPDLAAAAAARARELFTAYGITQAQYEYYEAAVEAHQVASASARRPRPPT